MVGFPGADSFCCGAAGAGFGFSSDRAASYAVAVAAAPSAMDINGTLLSVELPAFDANVRRIAPSVPTSWTDLPDSAIPTDAAARRATARSMTLEPTRRPDDAFTSYAYRASQTPALSSVVTTKVQDWSLGFHISTDHFARFYEMTSTTQPPWKRSPSRTPHTPQPSPLFDRRRTGNTRPSPAPAALT